jgi:hypothetical protein
MANQIAGVHSNDNSATINTNEGKKINFGFCFSFKYAGPKNLVVQKFSQLLRPNYIGQVFLPKTPLCLQQESTILG